MQKITLPCVAFIHGFPFVAWEHVLSMRLRSAYPLISLLQPVLNDCSDMQAREHPLC